MSNGYGYFRIEFFTENSSPDEDAAKRAFDWCKEHYPWSNGSDGEDNAPFVLRGHAFVANGEAWPDGLDIKHLSIVRDGEWHQIPDGISWLAKPFRMIRGARLVASIHQDFSESSYDSNTYIEGVWERGKRYREYIVNFNSCIRPAFDVDGKVPCHIDDCMDGTYRTLRGLFRNSKTGEEILAGAVIHECDVDEDCEMTGMLTIGEASFPLSIGDDAVEAEFEAGDAVKAFVEELRKVEGHADEDVADWRFERFCSQRSFFDLYGSNPPLSEYRMLVKGYGGNYIREPDVGTVPPTKAR
jgi:hypothetical protein